MLLIQFKLGTIDETVGHTWPKSHPTKINPKIVNKSLFLCNYL